MDLLSRSSWFVPLLMAACVPDFVDDTTRVSEPRILAIRAEPAEAAERESVKLVALVAEPRDDSQIAWSLCLDRKPLSELGPVSPQCLQSPDLEPSLGVSLGSSNGNESSVKATLPDIACQLFGPQRPDPKAGEPAGRPVDPDPTGGFYQPALAWLGQTAVLTAVRLACPLSGATREGLVEFNQRYRRNENPLIERFELVRGSGEVNELAPDGEVQVAPGESVELRVTWPACPSEPRCGDGICGPDETVRVQEGSGSALLECAEDCRVPRGCGGAERYVIYDPIAQAVELRGEELVVSWYATAGDFDAARTDSASLGTQEAAGSRNRFRAPASGRVQLWAIVRDDRGGVSWSSVTLRVVP